MNMGFLRELFGPSQEEIWAKLAAQVGGRFDEGGFFSGTNKVEVNVGEWVLTLDTFTRHHGKSHTTYTRLRAPYVNADGFRFTIYDAGLFTPLGKALGMQDIEIGDGAFDARFVLKGYDEQKVRQFFADDALKALFFTLTDIHMEVQDDEGWFGTKFPGDVDELYFERSGVMTDLIELRALFDLFSYSLHRLCHMGSAYENDPGIRL
jgi:hypothetical protein